METKTQELEIVKPEQVDVLRAITSSEIDCQISTAHKFPRSMEKFQKRALEMVTMDEETAASCLYRRPVGKNQDGSQKYAEGLSVRMAEIVGASYGNLRVASMLVEQTERYVKARGMAHDLESNFASTSEVIEATIDRNGNPMSERMRVVVAKSALAKARRDATFQVVPKALCRKLEESSRQVAIGDASTLEKRRGQVMDWIGKLGVDARRVFAALGISGEADIGLDQLETLTGLKTAIKEGDTSVDEAFPVTVQQAAKPLFKNGTPRTPAATTPPTSTPPTTPTPETPKRDNGLVLGAIIDKHGVTDDECTDWLRANKWIGPDAHLSDIKDDQLKVIEVNPDAWCKQVKGTDSKKARGK